MKKITVLMLVLFLLINGFTAFSADPVEKDVSSAPLEFMSALQIIDPDVDPPQSTVSRAVFSLYVARLLNIDENETSDVRYFSDMPMNHFAASAVDVYKRQTQGRAVERLSQLDGNSLTVRPQEGEKGILAAAAYNGGRLLDLEIKNISDASNPALVIGTQGADTVKAFLWDGIDTMLPALGAGEIH